MPLAVLMAYALSDVALPWQPRRMNVSALFADAGLKESAQQADTLAVDSAKQRILFFGDSMLEGLGPRMAQWAEASGHELTYVCWYSSSTELWAQGDTLASFMRKAQPTYVMVCIGSNEQFVRDLDKRGENIDSLLAMIGSVPSIWICPPAWKEDTGINELIRSRVGQRRFFDSRRLEFRRGKDHVHPVRSSSAEWMDSVIVWMQSRETAHPITFSQPQDSVKAACHSYYLGI